MYAKSRKVYSLNGPRAVPLPDGTPIGADDMASVAADKLVLVDPLLRPDEARGGVPRTAARLRDSGGPPLAENGHRCRRASEPSI